MKRIKILFAGLTFVALLALAGCAGQGVAAETLARPQAGEAQGFSASNQLAPDLDKDNPGKGGKDDKGNKANKANNGKNDKNDDKGNKGGKNDQGPNRGETVNNSRPGLGAWWRDFNARVFGRGAGLNEGGWQLGRFKDVFPFMYPPGWVVRERGDALLLTGPWQGRDYLFQMTRSVQVEARSLEQWVTADLQRLGIAGTPVQYAQAGNVRVAVVTGVKDADYECPVAYVYMWTANPAGNNQRQALGVISQAPGSGCDPAALNAFVRTYLSQVSGDTRPLPASTPFPTNVPATAVPTATASPANTATPTPAASGDAWQRTRFFNAFSFAYPATWSMDRLGDTAHLQGNYRGQAYVVDIVWVRDAPQVGLEQWARADLTDLGVNMEGVRLDYAPQGNEAQVAVVSGLRLQGYQCPVVRMYVVADNAATGGQRAYTVNLAQANGQACNPQALEDLAFQMLQQA